MGGSYCLQGSGGGGRSACALLMQHGGCTCLRLSSCSEVGLPWYASVTSWEGVTEKNEKPASVPI